MLLKYFSRQALTQKFWSFLVSPCPTFFVCLSALASARRKKKTKIAGLRNTQLTLLLKDSLGGNSKTTMIAGESPPPPPPSFLSFLLHSCHGFPSSHSSLSFSGHLLFLSLSLPGAQFHFMSVSLSLSHTLLFSPQPYLRQWSTPKNLCVHWSLPPVRALYQTSSQSMRYVYFCFFVISWCHHAGETTVKPKDHLCNDVMQHTRTPFPTIPGSNSLWMFRWIGRRAAKSALRWTCKGSIHKRFLFTFLHFNFNSVEVGRVGLGTT